MADTTPGATDRPVTMNELATLFQQVLGYRPDADGDHPHRHRLDLAQQRLELAYGAVRNASGYAGRSGQEVALVPSTLALPSGEITFLRSDLRDARRAFVYDRAGAQLQELHLVGDKRTEGELLAGQVDQPAELAWVEVRDDRGDPVYLSIPVGRTTTTPKGARS
jgi:hypothetical protein